MDRDKPPAAYGHMDKPLSPGVCCCVDRIERMFMKSPHLQGKMLGVWLGLSAGQRAGFRRTVRRIITEELLGSILQTAIAKTLMPDDGPVQLDSPLYHYLREYVFHGNSLATLSNLRSWKDQEGLHPATQRRRSRKVV